MSYKGGYLYTLKFVSKHHACVEREIQQIETICQTLDKTHGFHKVSNILSGKVLSFAGHDRKKNELYLSMFDAHGAKKPEVTAISALKMLSNPSTTDQERSEYDVVKKRRMMESAPPEEESVPEALADFEEFEASVLPALERISLEEREFREREMLEMEEILASGGVLAPLSGGVYFAWSPCLECMKIGATRRDDPSIRLRELSMQVTEPYHLVAWLPTPTPFKLEKAAHRHFDSQRINAARGAGAGTEFFRIHSRQARAYVERVQGKGGDGGL